jgi:hypothetical protein
MNPASSIESMISENPYAYTQSSALPVPADVQGTFGDRELAAVVGPKADDYLHQWKTSTRFNWAAFFFGGAWMMYRKMYLETFALVGSCSILNLVVHFGYIAAIGTVPPSQIQALLSIATWVVIGCWANLWYRYHVGRVISKARSHGHEGEELLQVLAKRGGTSAVAVVLFVVAMITLFIATPPTL